MNSTERGIRWPAKRVARVCRSILARASLLGLVGLFSAPVLAARECDPRTDGAREPALFQLPRNEDRIEHTIQVCAQLVPYAETVRDSCYPTTTTVESEESWEDVIVKDPMIFMFGGDGFIEVGIFVTGVTYHRPDSVLENDHVPLVALLINGQPPHAAWGT